MDYSEIIRARYSVRQYKPKKVESFKLAQILEAGRIAPTGCNKQPFKLLVCDSEESLSKINKGANIYGAPLAIIICADAGEAWIRPYDEKNIAEIDASIVTTQMMLEATNQGLGSVWICKFEPEKIRAEFNIPENLEPINILALGYADGPSSSLTRFDKQRKKIADLVVYNQF